MKRPLAFLLAAALLLLSGCGAGNSEPQIMSEDIIPQNGQAAAGAESLSLYPAAANMPVGRQLKLKAALSPAGASAQWTSSNEAVATVDENGKVEAVAPGECTVTVASGDKSAECAVMVEEDCRTVIFSTKPAKSGSENPLEPPDEGTEGEAPIEVPPDVIEVEQIPEADEFIWSLVFDDTYTTLVTNQNIPVVVDVTILFTAEKQGGKTGLGSYSGTFSGDADIDKENFLKTMNENPEVKNSGARFSDYTENDEGFQSMPVTLEVTELDDDVYHEAQYGHIPAEKRSPAQQLPLPISKMLPGSMMALGEISGMNTVSGTITMEISGQSQTVPFGSSEVTTQPYSICIYPSGTARLFFPLMEKDGFARNWVDGMLIKRPMV